MKPRKYDTLSDAIAHPNEYEIVWGAADPFALHIEGDELLPLSVDEFFQLARLKRDNQ